MLLKIEINEVSEMARSIIERYARTEIDSVYIVYNEFKSVIAQRVVVEKLLPIRKLGAQEITAAEVMTEEQRERPPMRRTPAASASTSPRRHGVRGGGKKFGTADVDYIFEQPPERTLPPPAAALRHDAALPCAAGVGRRRTRRPYDRDGCGDQQRRDMIDALYAHHEPCAAGRDYQGNYRDCQRRSRAVETARASS